MKYIPFNTGSLTVIFHMVAVLPAKLFYTAVSKVSDLLSCHPTNLFSESMKENRLIFRVIIGRFLASHQFDANNIVCFSIVQIEIKLIILKNI